jgi:hypothetical protein
MSNPIPITAARRFFQTVPRCPGNCKQGRKPCDCPTGKLPYQFLEPSEEQAPLSPGEKVVVGAVLFLCLLLLGALIATAARTLS